MFLVLLFCKIGFAASVDLAIEVVDRYSCGVKDVCITNPNSLDQETLRELEIID